MKKLIAGTVLALSPMLTQAAGYGASGCGAGSMIWKGQSGTGPHVLAFTTNGISGNATFGMTSGTLGCDTNEPVSVASVYVDSNMEKLARDVSRGEGETLSTLAELMQVEGTDRAHFKQVMQSNFTSIFAHESVTSDKVMSSIDEVMAEDQRLAQYAS